MIIEWLDRHDSLRRSEPSRHALANVVTNSLNAATNGDRLPTKFDILQSYNAELYQSLKSWRFGQRQMGSSDDDDDDDNRDYEGEHMRLVKHTHLLHRNKASVIHWIRWIN
jgi:hypothetical protein